MHIEFLIQVKKVQNSSLNRVSDENFLNFLPDSQSKTQIGDEPYSLLCQLSVERLKMSLQSNKCRDSSAGVESLLFHHVPPFRRRHFS